MKKYKKNYLILLSFFSDITFPIASIFFYRKKYATYLNTFSIRVHRIFTGTRAVSVKADLHVIIGGRCYIDDRDLYRLTVTSSPLRRGDYMGISYGSIGTRPRIDS